MKLDIYISKRDLRCISWQYSRGYLMGAWWLVDWSQVMIMFDVSLSCFLRLASECGKVVTFTNVNLLCILSSWPSSTTSTNKTSHSEILIVSFRKMIQSCSHLRDVSTRLLGLWPCSLLLSRLHSRRLSHSKQPIVIRLGCQKTVWRQEGVSWKDQSSDWLCW